MLLDRNFGAGDGATGEVLFATRNKFDNTVFGSMDRVVAAHECAFAGELGLADLAHEDFAFTYFLTTETLDAESLAG